VNYYILPEGNVQIAFSGGRTSAYMLHQILEANGGLPDRARVVFTNTGREMPETLNFVQECGVRWGVSIAIVEYSNSRDGNRLAPSFREVTTETADMTGQPFIDLLEYHAQNRTSYVPNRAADFCSHDLKTRTAKRFCMDALGWTHWTTALGIRNDEKSRVQKKQPRERWKVWYPLNDAKVSKHDVAMFWKKQPFDLRLENVNGVTPRGNCDGCFKKSEWKRAALARDFPDRAAWWAEQEARFGGTFQDGQKWAQLIDFVERQGDWIFDESNDALCQVDGGECTG
jgi:3'-phosphoadenosine 5'-phosphosulfate sulfotransferase (PAPS reductase)/FAD synthetase